MAYHVRDSGLVVNDKNNFVGFLMIGWWLVDRLFNYGSTGVRSMFSG